MSRSGAGRRDAASSVAPIPRYGRSLRPCLTTSIARLATGVMTLGALGPVAHGGVAGAIAESLIVIAISAVLVAVWVRERRAGRASEGPARLRDDEEA